MKVLPHLNEAERQAINYLIKSRERYDKKKHEKMAFEAMALGGFTDTEMLLHGTAAEIAFCKWQNIYPNLETRRFRTPDFVKEHGPLKLTGEVKHTIRVDGNLLVPHWKNPSKYDIYVLVTGRMPQLCYVGWIGGEEVFKEERIEKGKYGKSYYFISRFELEEILPWEK
jgi:hypothetical protein